MRKWILALLLAFSTLGFASDDACVEKPEVEAEKVVELCALVDATGDATEGESAVQTCFKLRMKTLPTKVEDGTPESEEEDCEDGEPSEQENPV